VFVFTIEFVFFFSLKKNIKLIFILSIFHSFNIKIKRNKFLNVFSIKKYS
jgi:hypothetical protein